MLAVQSGLLQRHCQQRIKKPKVQITVYRIYSAVHSSDHLNGHVIQRFEHTFLFRSLRLRREAVGLGHTAGCLADPLCHSGHMAVYLSAQGVLFILRRVDL